MFHSFGRKSSFNFAIIFLLGLFIVLLKKRSFTIEGAKNAQYTVSR
jgi:hypothetical protein